MSDHHAEACKITKGSGDTAIEQSCALRVDSDVGVEVGPKPRPDQLARQLGEALPCCGLTYPAQNISLTTAVLNGPPCALILLECKQEATKRRRHIR